MFRITFFIALMLTAPVALAHQSPKPPDAPSSNDGAGAEKTFTDAAVGVTCAYPADWKIVDPSSAGEHALLCVQPSSGPLAAPAAHMRLIVSSRPRNRSADGDEPITADNEKFSLSYLADRKHVLDHFEIMDTRNARVGGRSGVRVDGSCTVEGEGVRTRDMVIAHGDSILMFTMTCRADDFDANRAAFTRLLATVKLAKPDPKAAKTATSQPTSRPAGNGRDASFVSAENHFKFSYPAKWQPAPNFEKAVFVAMLDDDKASRSMFSVMINGMPPRDMELRPIERAMRWIVDDSRKTAMRNVSEAEELEVDGRPMMQFSADIIQGGVKCRANFLIAVEFDHTIAVMVFAPIPREAEVKATIDQLKRTWRWLD